LTTASSALHGRSLRALWQRVRQESTTAVSYYMVKLPSDFPWRQGRPSLNQVIVNHHSGSNSTQKHCHYKPYDDRLRFPPVTSADPSQAQVPMTLSRVLFDVTRQCAHCYGEHLESPESGSVFRCRIPNILTSGSKASKAARCRSASCAGRGISCCPSGPTSRKAPARRLPRRRGRLHRYQNLAEHLQHHRPRLPAGVRLRCWQMPVQPSGSPRQYAAVHASHLPGHVVRKVLAHLDRREPAQRGCT